MAKAVEHFGRLDVLINNAGGAPHALAAEQSPRFVEAIVGLNLLAPLWCAQSAHKVMEVQEDGGSIINVASVSALRPSRGASAYGAAKAGLMNLTATLAVEWAPQVRVNCVSGGLLDTGAGDDFYGGPGGMERMAATVPLGRMGTPEDVAAVPACSWPAPPPPTSAAPTWSSTAVANGPPSSRVQAEPGRHGGHPRLGAQWGQLLNKTTVKLAVPTETRSGERRVALVPDVVKKLVGAGWEVSVQSGRAPRPPSTTRPTPRPAPRCTRRPGTVAGAELVVRVNPPSADEVAALPQGATL